MSARRATITATRPRLRITYKLTRELWLKTEYRHDWLRSSVAGANYDADVILLTLRAQR